MKIITIEEHFNSRNVRENIKQFQSKDLDEGKAKDMHEMIRHFLPTDDDIDDVGARRIKFMDESGIHFFHCFGRVDVSCLEANRRKVPKILLKEIQ